MQIPVDHDGEHWIGARAPQVLTYSGTAATPITQTHTVVSSTSPFFPDPSTVNTTTPAQAPHDNSKAVRVSETNIFLIIQKFLNTY